VIAIRVVVNCFTGYVILAPEMLQRGIGRGGGGGVFVHDNNNARTTRSEKINKIKKKGRMK
jgi:hypothetical protein